VALPEIGSAAVPPLDESAGLSVAKPGDVSPPVVRASIERHGSLLVRGMVGPGQVKRLRAAIDAAFVARDEAKSGRPSSSTAEWYDELEDVPDGGGRDFTAFAGVVAGDSPRGFFELLEVFRQLGICALADAVFGERAAVSFEKTVLRRVPPGNVASWHQDGAF